MNLVFDIETGPACDIILNQVKPSFTAPSNYKDPEKIASAISAEEAEWKSKAALSATTGVVLAVGLKTKERERLIIGDEPFILNAFWNEWSIQRLEDGCGKFVGFCIKSFDLPFLVQRSWVNGVKVPFDLFEGRYWSRNFVDLQEVWLCNGFERKGANLDIICKALGLGGKNGNGKDFAQLFSSDKPAAMEYLKRDIELTYNLAVKLGIVG